LLQEVPEAEENVELVKEMALAFAMGTHTRYGSIHKQGYGSIHTIGVDDDGVLSRGPTRMSGCALRWLSALGNFDFTCR